MTVHVAADVRRRTFSTSLEFRLLTSSATGVDANSWNFWLYPAQIDSPVPTNVLLTSSWDEAEAKLAAGGKVVFQPPLAMNGVALMPRENDCDHQGDIRGCAISVSEDGQTWREVARGGMASTWNPQTIECAQTVTAKQLKFTSLSGFGAETSSALAELAVLYAGPKLPDNTAGKVEYRRARSTSSDIDEGRAAPAPTSGKPPVSP